MFGVMFIKCLYNFLLSLALAQVSPWMDIESQINSKKKKLAEINLQLLEMSKPQFKLPSEDEEIEFVNKISALKEEKRSLEKDIDKLTQELKYRFPERGLKLNTQPADVQPQIHEVKEKKEDTPAQVSEDAVTQSMQSLRRQFGSPLSQDEKKALGESKTLPRLQKSGKNPIQDKIIISK